MYCISCISCISSMTMLLSSMYIRMVGVGWMCCQSGYLHSSNRGRNRKVSIQTLITHTRYTRYTRNTRNCLFLLFPSWSWSWFSSCSMLFLALALAPLSHIVLPYLPTTSGPSTGHQPPIISCLNFSPSPPKHWLSFFLSHTPTPAIYHQ